MKLILLFLIAKYASFIAKLGVRFSGHSLAHRVINRILHLLCPDWLIRRLKGLIPPPDFDFKEAKQIGLDKMGEAIEFMPDDALDKIVASIRDGTFGEGLNTMLARFPISLKEIITEAEFAEIFEREKFLREHRERH